MTTAAPHVSRRLDFVFAVLFTAGVVGASLALAPSLRRDPVTVWEVFAAAALTAAATGLGALPFLFSQKISGRWLGVGNSLAAGLMLGAGVGLVREGMRLEDVDHAGWRVAIGAGIGVVVVWAAHRLLSRRKGNLEVGGLQGANAVQMLLIVGVMTIHSFAEGVGVGVSFGDGGVLGGVIALSIAVHNIPEGLAISLVLIPKGAGVKEAAGWSIFSSLPQPLVAVPAFWFVLSFRQFLPAGLGLAAGAMGWMVVWELVPEAKKEIGWAPLAALSAISCAGMVFFQWAMNH